MSMRSSRHASSRLRRLGASPLGERSQARDNAERVALGELEAWRARAVPDASAPLDADDLPRLLRDCLSALRLDPAVADGFTVNTVHYYRRKDIIDPPEGRTAAARYAIRHLWQIAGARLAGHLGLVTLAEARAAMRGADTPALLAFLAARVADARARAAVRSQGGSGETATPNPSPAVRPLAQPSAAAPASAPEAAMMIPLPGDAWCIVPASHAAHHSTQAAGALVRALADALHKHRTPGE
jgi:hypothetical protein